MATIIKSGSSEARLSGTHVNRADFRFEDFEAKAEQYLDQVRSEAAGIIQDAHQQAAQIRQAAEAAGRQSAMEAAERVLDEKVGQRLQTLLPALQQAVRGIEDSRHDWIRNWERGTLRLATGIASRIVRRQIEIDPTLPLEWIQEALSLAAGSGVIRLHLHPSDAESLGGNVDAMLADVGKLGTCEVVQDANVAIGGCRVTTEFGEIDQQLETQFARIEEELLG